MNIFVRFIFRLLPNELVEELNDLIMDELGERGLIIWQDEIESGAVVWAEDLQRMNKEEHNNPGASQRRFTPLMLTSQECLNLVIKLRMDFNQTQIIERVWEVKKDGSDAWNEAYAEYKDVMETVE